MPNIKIENPLDKKVPDAYSVTARTKFAFRDICHHLRVNPSNIVEELMLNYIKDNLEELNN